MAIFRYQAYNSSGVKVSGIVEATTEAEAKEKLREKNLVITSFSVKGKLFRREALRGDQLVAFTVQLSQLVGAGVPLFDSLMAIEEQSRNEPYHRVLIGLADQVKAGATLSSAMESYPNSFDRLYCAMIAAGEAIGALDVSLKRLSDLITRERQLMKNLTTALVYPGVLGTFSLLVIGLLLGFVVPSIEGIFEGRRLGLLTTTVIGASHLFRSYWWLLMVIVGGAGMYLSVQMRSEAFRASFQRLLMRVPVINKVLLEAAMIRFARTVSSLLLGGMNMIESLRIGRQVMKNVVLEEVIERAEERIVQGSSLSRELGRNPIIPPLFSRMLGIGEDTGNVAGMLEKIADLYDQELEKNLSRAMALVQPLILVLMGALIGVILMAILLPLTDTAAILGG